MILAGEIEVNGMQFCCVLSEATPRARIQWVIIRLGFGFCQRLEIWSANSDFQSSGVFIGMKKLLTGSPFCSKAWGD